MRNSPPDPSDSPIKCYRDEDLPAGNSGFRFSLFSADRSFRMHRSHPRLRPRKKRTRPRPWKNKSAAIHEHFGPQISFMSDAGPSYLQGDFNGDGFPDLAAIVDAEKWTRGVERTRSDPAECESVVSGKWPKNPAIKPRNALCRCCRHARHKRRLDQFGRSREVSLLRMLRSVFARNEGQPHRAWFGFSWLDAKTARRCDPSRTGKRRQFAGVLGRQNVSWIRAAQRGLNEMFTVHTFNCHLSLMVALRATSLKMLREAPPQ